MSKKTEEQVTMSKSEFEAILANQETLQSQVAGLIEQNKQYARESVGNKLASGIILETGPRVNPRTGRPLMLEDGYGKDVLDTDGKPIERIFSNIHLSVLTEVGTPESLLGERFEKAKQFAIEKGYSHVQMNMSLSESNFMKHDPKDPVGCDRALAFRCDTDSMFSVEYLHETIARDPKVAFDMQAPRERAQQDVKKTREAGR